MSMRAHKEAPHLQAAFRQLPHTNLMPVKIALEEAIGFLLSLESTEFDFENRPVVLMESDVGKHSSKPTASDLKNPDYGIPYALEIERRYEREEIKSACQLLCMCLHAIERGETVESERDGIPLLLASLVGFVPDRNKRAAKKVRPNARKRDDLDDGIEDALKALPADEATWKDILNWLDRHLVIYEWDGGKFKFKYGDGEVTLTEKTLRGRITKIKRNKR